MGLHHLHGICLSFKSPRIYLPQESFPRFPSLAQALLVYILVTVLPYVLAHIVILSLHLGSYLFPTEE